MSQDSGPIATRFSTLHTLRTCKLDRARELSKLTIPSILPVNGWTENTELIAPMSSASGQACTFLASKMHAAMIPLNDIPFVEIKPTKGTKISMKARQYLEDITRQLHEKLLSNNLREAFYEALIHLIIVGDVLVFMDNEFSFKIYRLDQYVAVRNASGDMVELIVVDYELSEEPQAANAALPPPDITEPTSERPGYTKVYSQYIKVKGAEGKPEWKCNREKTGNKINLAGKDTFKVLPFCALRWTAIAGENYGRSHCELHYGDILADEEYTRAMHYGMIAASMFWMGISKEAGVPDLDLIAKKPIGTWVECSPDPKMCGAISPASTINPQIKTMMDAVVMSRERIGKAFLQTGMAIPQGDRVTATAIRAIGLELEQVLGGTFSAIAREFFVTIATRTLFLLVDKKQVDEKLMELFDPLKGSIKYDIVTGLQALGKESDLNKIMQMFEVFRNLPEQALQTVKWNNIMQQSIRSMGWNPDDYVETLEETESRIQAQQQQAMQQQEQMMAQEAMAKAIPPVAGQAAKGLLGETSS